MVRTRAGASLRGPSGHHILHVRRSGIAPAQPQTRSNISLPTAAFRWGFRVCGLVRYSASLPSSRIHPAQPIIGEEFAVEACRYHVRMNARHTVPPKKTPSDITSPAWQEILRRTWRAASSQHSSLDAAGIAFFGVWAFFPTLAALVALGGLLFGRPEILHLLSRVRIDLPESLDVIVVRQLQAIASHSRTASSATLIGGLFVALWSSMRAMRGLIAALNFIYGEEEKRTFWHRQALVFVFTCFGGAFLLIVLALILAIPPWVSGAKEPTFAFVAVSRWPILIVMLMVSLSALYRYGPSRPTAKWRWVSSGAAASTIIWVAGSLLFSYYTSQFTRLNPLLGSLGAFTLFFLWSYLTVLTILLGARVNAEMERQADKDGTPDRLRSR